MTEYGREALARAGYRNGREPIEHPPDDGWQPPAAAPEGPSGPGYAAKPPPPLVYAIPPLTIAEWLARDDLPDPDCLLGHWLSTTSRVLLVAPTGLGKTNFAMALGFAIAAERGFLHWSSGGRTRRVLLIDGEMSRRLLKRRIREATARGDGAPTTFYALSREDLDNFAPLNTPEGQAALLKFIEAIGGVDLVIFDNIMSLTVGDMKETIAWAQTLPLIAGLTRACIAQIWIHHTGHDENRSYGDKTREWQMDTVVHLQALS
jgi:RecA-family ATPase